uniref:Uncharacterized protein n=1 Tax=Bartonella schoenbuchensis (strain DSM 13525 / NCTC 13165 / R1) TaxID=687861 RepID=E6Z164_BARSR|nr:hypothetical protein BARSC_190123 [Bartonella schoenbuchensis R1]
MYIHTMLQAVIYADIKHSASLKIFFELGVGRCALCYGL